MQPGVDCDPDYATEVGDYLVIMITGRMSIYIAEITQLEPLEMKVLEIGSLSRLKAGECIVLSEDTRQFQLDRIRKTDTFLRNCRADGRTVLSGLKSLGFKDGKLHEVLPG